MRLQLRRALAALWPQGVEISPTAPVQTIPLGVGAFFSSDGPVVPVGPGRRDASRLRLQPIASDCAVAAPVGRKTPRRRNIFRVPPELPVSPA